MIQQNKSLSKYLTEKIDLLLLEKRYLAKKRLNKKAKYGIFNIEFIIYIYNNRAVCK